MGSTEVELIESGDSVCRSIAAGTPFEPETLEVWAQLCEGGGTVIDVGAYAGLFSIAAARLGCRRVIAVEPMHAERCRQNFALCGVHPELHEACATDHSGMVAFRYNPLVPGMTAGGSLIRPSGGTESVERRVPAMTLDSLGLEECRAVKIDVERAEPLVLAGARELLRRCRPTLIVEALGDEERRAVLEAAPEYEVVHVADERNLVMVPAW